MIISFSGMDGTGKTKHAKATISFLEKLGKKTKYIHIMQFSISGKIGNILKKTSKKAHDRIVDEEFNSKKKTFARGFIGFWKKITFIMDIFRFYFTCSFNSALGRIIVCDRYFYDMNVQLLYLGMAGKVYIRFHKMLIPKPEIAFFLSILPKEAFRRADEYNTDYFKRKNSLYKKLGIEFKVINTKKDFDYAQKDIELILKSVL